LRTDGVPREKRAFSLGQPVLPATPARRRPPVVSPDQLDPASLVHSDSGVMQTKTYKPKTFNLSDLEGISNQTLEMHFKLYEGYVTNTNTLTERISAILADGKVDQEEMPAYSELTRRLGFEYNGMVLHEYYFGNMKRHGGDEAPKGSQFRAAVESSFPSYEIWKTDFVSVG
jgi:Fe-Mn family superoxide dismutase